MELYEGQIKTIEENLAVLTQHLKDYQHLDASLESLAMHLRIKSMVPLTHVSFMEGYLKPTHGITVLLGDDWFAEMSLHEAHGLIQRRMSHLQDQIVQWESERTKTQQRQTFLNALLDQEEASNLFYIREDLNEKTTQREATFSQPSSLPTKEEASIKMAPTVKAPRDLEMERIFQQLTVLEQMEEEESQKKLGTSRSSNIIDSSTMAQPKIETASISSLEDQPSKPRVSRFKASRQLSSQFQI
jgi:prefoldin subunit 5